MNYRTLFVAGYGTIGSSIVRLGNDALELFESVVVVDKDFTGKPVDFADSRVKFITGDIEDPEMLATLCKNMKAPALLVNVAASVDNVQIRKTVSPYAVAYVDSCASSLPDKTEYRFSQYMPYTFTEVPSRYPHWLCWGINPGLVELMARKLIRQLGEKKVYEVNIFENDQLHARLENGGLAVGWSPEMLVEETMLSPTLQIQDRRIVEREASGTEKIMAHWAGAGVPSRIVGHEDIWNIGRLGTVKDARFIYALHPEVMAVLEGDPEEALKILKVPDRAVPLTGNEKVAVCVERIDSGEKRSIFWESDHEAIWKRYGINAVQYQTGKSLLLAILLMQKTRYGRFPCIASASDLPVDTEGWDIIDEFMDALEIEWKDGECLSLGTEPTDRQDA